MDLAFSAEEMAFRDEVRAFLAEKLPADLSDKVSRNVHLSREDVMRWHRILHEQGWIAGGWPKSAGGCEWSAAQRYIFDEECAAHSAPPLAPFGLMMVGPVIYTFGNDAQKAEYLPKILSGEHYWCQGYSEPGSGSDLASLKTTAVREGDEYVINGHKIWTSYAHYADWMFCLVRTDKDAKQQQGISFILIDMTTSGIDIKPIITMDHGHTVNEVFFDNVRVPAKNLIGEENKGWTYAKFLLGNERTGIAGVGRSKHRIQELKKMAANESASGGRLIDDPAFSKRIAEIEQNLAGLEITNLRNLAEAVAGRPVGAEASMLKLVGTDVEQAINQTMADALGYYGAPYVHTALNWGQNVEPVGPAHADGIMPENLLKRASSIYGGSSEVQRSVIAKAVLGL